jgi:hypothetical protein
MTDRAFAGGGAFARPMALLFAAAAVLTGSLLVRPAAAAPLTGELLRTWESPFGIGSTVGWGLAADGVYLYASATRDGLIRVVHPDTMAVLRTISTPAANYLGLAYRDGYLYGVEQPDIGSTVIPSRFYTLDLASEMVVHTFDGPSDGFSSLTFGPDGLLYSSDGFEGSGITGTRTFCFRS